MSRASIKASSLYSEAKMTDTTRVKFDVPIGTWGQTQIEVEYPWHRDLDSIILPLLEKAHEQQAERQRKHRAEAQPDRKSSRRTKNTTIAERTDRADRAEQQQTTLPMRPNEDIKLFLKGFESAGDFTTKRGDTIQRVLENYAQQAEKDVERLELFHKGKHVSRSMTPDTGSKTAPNCKSTSSLDNSGSTSTSTIQARRANRRRKKTSRNRQKSPENTTAPQEEEEEETQEEEEQQQDADNGNDDDPPNSIERGSILVANDIITINTTSPGGRTHIHTNTNNNEESSANRPKSLSPSLPPKSPLRRSSIHARTPSWASGQTSTTSDKALRLLGIDTNELAHQLAKIDSVMPLQRFTSGSVTQVELQPGPSRGVPVVQGPRKVSVVSDRAYGGEAEQLEMEGGGGRRPSMISSLEQEDEEEEGDCHLRQQNQRQYYIDHSDVSSLHDSLHESLQEYSLSSHEHRRSTTTTTHEESSDRKTSTTTSNNKARKLLGVDRPDSYPGPTGRLGSTYTDYERRSQSYLTTGGGGGGRVGGPPPQPPPTTYYPTQTTSYAHPDPLEPFPCKRRNAAAQRSGSHAIDYRPRSCLVGIPHDEVKARKVLDLAPRIPADWDQQPQRRRHTSIIPAATTTTTLMTTSTPATAKRASAIISPFAVAEFEDQDLENDDNDDDNEVKIVTTCSGPVGDIAGEETGPEFAIQYKVAGKVVKRCPRMSGIIENIGMRRSWSA